MSQQTFDKNIQIPVVNDLVLLGDPELKQRVRENLETIECKNQEFDLRLKRKMAELRETIGQEEGDNIARAHAIRAEAGGPHRKVSDTHHEMNLDRDRAEVMKRLSRNDPE
jgi:hypothetical protein